VYWDAPIYHIMADRARRPETLVSKSAPSSDECPVYRAFDPYATPLDGDFYHAVCAAHLHSSGRELGPRVITGWYHGAAFGVPCFLYGPGNGGNSHGADEYFELASFDVTVPALVEIASTWCGGDQAGRVRR
jgi:acetylornithine deacetylase/succinyl-diaminopimelate desuccinylase-like protein